MTIIVAHHVRIKATIQAKFLSCENYIIVVILRSNNFCCFLQKVVWFAVNIKKLYFTGRRYDLETPNLERLPKTLPVSAVSSLRVYSPVALVDFCIISSAKIRLFASLCNLYRFFTVL
jgi:hypothetical protein